MGECVEETRMDSDWQTAFSWKKLFSIIRNLIFTLIVIAVAFHVTYWTCVAEVNYVSFIDWGTVGNLCYIRGFESIYCSILFGTALMTFIYFSKSASHGIRKSSDDGNVAITLQKATKLFVLVSAFLAIILVVSFWGSLWKIHTGVLSFMAFPVMFNSDFLSVTIPSYSLRGSVIILFGIVLTTSIVRIGADHSENVLGIGRKTYTTVDCRYIQSIKVYKDFLTSKTFQKGVLDKSRVLYLGKLGGYYIFVPIKDYSESIPKYTDFLRLGKDEIQPFMFEKTPVVRTSK